MNGQSVLFNMATLRMFINCVVLSVFLGVCQAQSQSVGQGRLTARQRLEQSLRGQGQTTVSPLREDVKRRLTRLVQFVINPTAVPSENMIQFAVMMGGSPKTQAEKLMYIVLMKQVAETHPEFTERFKSANGTLDEQAMTLYLRQRAQQFVIEKSVPGTAATQAGAVSLSAVAPASGPSSSFSGSMVEVVPSVPASVVVPSVEEAMTNVNVPIVNLVQYPGSAAQANQQNAGNVNVLNLNNVQSVGDLLDLHNGGFLV